MARIKDDLNFIPKTQEELFKHYFQSGIVARLIKGIAKTEDDETIEELVSATFLRMVEHRVMEKFDATKSNFGGAVFFTVRSVTVNYLSAKSRDPIGNLSAGSLVEESEEFERGTYSLETLEEGSTGSPDDEHHARQQVQKLIAFATAAKERSKNKRDQSLLQLVKLLAEGNTPAEAAVELGVTTTTVTNWMSHLQSAIA